MKIVFEAPTKERPGYLKRIRKAMEFGAALSSGNATPKTLDDLINFLADYVIEPKSREDAIAALWDATEEQFLQLINIVKGDASGEAIDPPNAAP